MLTAMTTGFSLLAVLLAVLCGGTSAATAAQLIMLEEAGCPWCEMWDREIGPIYPKTEEGKRAPLRRLDIHSRLPAELAFLDKGGYTPTFILVDNGREIGRIRGYPGEDFFWGLLGKLIDKLPADRGLKTIN